MGLLVLVCITNVDERIVGIQKIFFKIRIGFCKEASYHIDQFGKSFRPLNLVSAGFFMTSLWRGMTSFLF
jgi:hypothetical protein